MRPIVFGIVLGLAITLAFLPIIFFIALRARRRRLKREQAVLDEIDVDSACEAWLERTPFPVHGPPEMMETERKRVQSVFIEEFDVDRERERIRRGRGRRRLSTIPEGSEGRRTVDPKNGRTRRGSA
jgi:hypothetical protein